MDSKQLNSELFFQGMKGMPHHQLKSSAGEQIFKGSFVEKLQAAGFFKKIDPTLQHLPSITTAPRIHSTWH